MSIFQADSLLLEVVNLMVEDIRKEPWLLDDILSQYITNPYLKQKYAGQIASFKEWYLSNSIDIALIMRKDLNKFPAITIKLKAESEIADMKLMADLSTESEYLQPDTIGKPIPYIVNPFPVSENAYDPDTGEVAIDESIAGMDTVVPGQLLVNPENGQGFKILEVLGDALVIDTGLDFKAARLGILPEYRYYSARREHTFFAASYDIELLVAQDQQTLLWLWSVVLYGILRYRESLLEANNFTQTVVSSSEMGILAGTSGPESVWSRTITVSGMLENSWLKSPRRILESVALREKTPEGYVGGIKILSNSEPSTVDESDVNWYAISDDE